MQPKEELSWFEPFEHKCQVDYCICFFFPVILTLFLSTALAYFYFF